jgi:hypothetical protein
MRNEDAHSFTPVRNIHDKILKKQAANLVTEGVTESLQVFWIVAWTAILYVFPQEAEKDNILMVHDLQDFIFAQQFKQPLRFSVNDCLSATGATCRRRRC